MNKLKIVPMFILGCVLSFKLIAGEPAPVMTLEEATDPPYNRWSIVASLGYTDFVNMYHHDGQTVVGRLAFAADLLTINQNIFGLEFGVQNGRSMRLAIPQDALNVFGSVVRTTMKPMLDLLITANSNLMSESLLFAQIKGGFAYRQWNMDNFLINSKTELAGEVQAGLGYPLSEVSSLNLLYQGIFGGDPKFRFNPLLETGHVSNIPIQHGVLLGLSIIV